MGLFGRRRDKRGEQPAEPRPDSPRDVHLPALTPQEAARFTAAAQRAFAEAGVETVPRGDGTLLGQDGRVLGLYNVAHHAAEGPESQWPALLEEHARIMAASNQTPPAPDLESVRDSLYLRLFSRSDVPGEVTGMHVAEGLVALVSIDHPEHVQSLTSGAELERLGPWPELTRIGLANLARLTAEETTQLDDEVLLSVGGFFHASRLLVLPQALASDFRIEHAAHGVLLAVPNRHLLAVHPLRDERFIPATQTLARIAEGESEKPGGISPHVWFWRDGAMQQVSRREDDRLVVRADGALGDALTELGLLGG